jgi:hypothetical protein
MCNLTDNEINKMVDLRKEVAYELMKIMEYIENGKKRHNKQALNDKIFDEIVASWYFREIFDLFLETQRREEKLKCMLKLKEFLNNVDSSDLFNDEMNVIYFVQKIMPNVLMYQLVEQFSDLGIKMSFAFVSDNRKLNFGGDFVVDVNFDFKYLKLDLNYNYTYKYIDLSFQSIIYNYLIAEKRRPEYRKAAADMFINEIFKGFARATNETNKLLEASS